MTFTEQDQNLFLGHLLAAAQAQPDRCLTISDGSGRLVMRVEALDVAVRPQDRPRHLRPKRPLSKRQRDAAKRGKRAARGVVASV